MERLSIDTPHGSSAAEVSMAAHGRGVVVLGHGAGGGIGAPDLVAATSGALDAGFHVILVEQPYRVAGRRAPPRAPLLDAAWIAVVQAVRGRFDDAAPLVVGGRSSGARVACRTATMLAAEGVLCLAFPLQPPRGADKPAAPSRIHELAAPEVPVLVVQGERDPFGMPPPARQRTVVVVAGDHGLKADPPAVRAAVQQWLLQLTGGRTPSPA